MTMREGAAHEHPSTLGKRIWTASRWVEGCELETAPYQERRANRLIGGGIG
jgi:hypothetical protein